jgi:hypothetical protein
MSKDIKKAQDTEDQVKVLNLQELAEDADASGGDWSTASNGCNSVTKNEWSTVSNGCTKDQEASFQ